MARIPRVAQICLRRRRYKNKPKEAPWDKSPTAVVARGVRIRFLAIWQRDLQGIIIYDRNTAPYKAYAEETCVATVIGGTAEDMWRADWVTLWLNKNFPWQRIDLVRENVAAGFTAYPGRNPYMDIALCKPQFTNPKRKKQSP